MGQNKAFSTNNTLNLNGRLMNLSTPCIMGILNITPDSFFEGSRVRTEKAILSLAEKMLIEGAAVLDVGGYSSRPDSEHISEEEESNRVLTAIKLIHTHFPSAILSIDTFRSSVAQKAINEGASIINDISAGELDTKMFDTVAQLKVPYIAMHMRGTPQTMKNLTEYNNPVTEVASYFSEKIYRLHQLGVKDIIVDPGFGFAKTIEQNFQLLSQLDYYQSLNKPILVGLSRKSMIWKTLNTTPEHALNGTTALNMVGLLKGASILRVHDVKEAVDTIKLFLKLI